MKQYTYSLLPYKKSRNVIKEKAKEHNLKYIQETDIRVNKPNVIFHQDNFNEKIVLASNWVLQSDNLETMMEMPNDVALYSSISLNHLKKVSAFQQKELIPRKKSLLGTKVLSKVELSVYYDYFETVITSVVFAYTAVEAFANLCIPFNYKYSYIDNEKNIVQLDKTQIERKLSLKEKLKTILPAIIGCDNPCSQSWWTKYTQLEALRDEIVHSKETKSEDRYSKMLSVKIKDKILTHKQIIEFFGKEISLNKPELLDIFPNGFGQDYYHIKIKKSDEFEKDLKLLGF